MQKVTWGTTLAVSELRELHLKPAQCYRTENFHIVLMPGMGNRQLMHKLENFLLSRKSGKKGFDSPDAPLWGVC
ncbi:hypothetical protein CEXT_147521 [Caerostris extrusa]|uniref:Uncharacterized protein n=1 Tax=Caerostris extrusa TaxID=172846 RepID=A0AAV4T2R1_CAEEX|nr:hypothetical protein CEXT_147521 [Caerostris extrusa]